MTIDINDLNAFVNANIVGFHESKANTLAQLSLHKLLKRKNPYLFRAKNLIVASDLIRDLLDAYLSSSEEKYFGDFLEELAIYIAETVYNGHKSASQGIDLEFSKDDVYYVIAIKSGSNWGNSSQHAKQEQDFKNAVTRLKQSNRVLNVQPVLGICYGKTKTTFPRNYMKVTGQNFWYLISGSRSLYTDIVEPIGYRARDHNEDFHQAKTRIIHRFTRQFMDEFCEDDMIIWQRLVEFNSRNFDLE
jgi:hypothetical protein